MSNPVKILLVEDNPADVKLTLSALKKMNLASTATVLPDGEAAMAYLRAQVQAQVSNLPDLILLDLNLPKLNGHEVLAEIKTDPQLKSIPVVILTSSDDQNDILMTYNNYANCYINKPLDTERLLELEEGIKGYWLKMVNGPKPS